MFINVQISVSCLNCALFWNFIDCMCVYVYLYLPMCLLVCIFVRVCADVYVCCCSFSEPFVIFCYKRLKLQSETMQIGFLEAKMAHR